MRHFTIYIFGLSLLTASCTQIDNKSTIPKADNTSFQDSSKSFQDSSGNYFFYFKYLSESDLPIFNSNFIQITPLNKDSNLIKGDTAIINIHIPGIPVAQIHASIKGETLYGYPIDTNYLYKFCPQQKGNIFMSVIIDFNDSVSFLYKKIKYHVIERSIYKW